jgi:phage shock protein PspC (stress-responsive transcriptional regulator)
MRDLSTLRRSRRPRMIGGVAEGLSRHFDVDPLLIRVAFFALTFFGGSGICLYVIAWLSIPEEGSYDSTLSRLFRTDPRRAMGAGLVFAGIVGAVTLIGAIGFTAPNPWPLLAVSAIVLVAIAIFGRRGERPPPPPWRPPDVTPTPDSPRPADAASTRAWWQRPAESGSADAVPPPMSPGSIAPPPPPPVTRQRSHLFAITMAATAIGLGLVWILDQGPIDEIEPAAYPATVLGVAAVGLLVGTWFGRSRLLIAVGILATLATAATAFVGPGPYGEHIYRPQSAAEVQGTYDHGVGRLVVHLENIDDPRQLDGLRVRIDEHIGELQVIVPSNLPVVLDAVVDVGEIAGPRASAVNDLAGGHQEAHLTSVPAGAAPALELDVHLDYGQIVITQYDCATSSPRSTGLDTTRRIGGTDAAPACP